jgi:Cu/Ag efflux pump CusA
MLILPDVSMDDWAIFLKDNSLLVHKFIFTKIKKAIKNNEQEAKLFMFENSSEKFIVRKENYIKSLQQILETFVEHEEYELAANVQKVINENTIEKIIKDINVGE